MELKKVNNDYIINGKDISTISGIESITFEEAEYLIDKLHGESFDAKGHKCFLIDLGGNFGYSVLVFKNNRHIYYANDYALHHSKRAKEKLKELYIERENNILFTDAELLEEIGSYQEYNRKQYFVHNYWIMRYDYQSVFGVYAGNGKAQKEWKKENEKYPYYCSTCFAYVKDKEIVTNAKKYISFIESEFTRLSKKEKSFREMISYELANHEACITREASETLTALGLDWDSLTDTQKSIVHEELYKQINHYENAE